MKSFLPLKLDEVILLILTKDKKLCKSITKEFLIFQKKDNNNNLEICSKDLKKTLIFIDSFFKKHRIKKLFNKKKKFSFAHFLNLLLVSLIESKLWRFNFLILHGASIRIESSSYIFIGQSGAGKSTLVKKFNSNSVLSEDICILRKIGKDFYVFPSIFEKKNNFNNKKYLLQKIFILRKEIKKNYSSVNKVKKNIGILQILKNDFTFVNKKFFPNLNPKLIKLTMELIKRLDVYNFNFFINDSKESLIKIIKRS